MIILCIPGAIQLLVREEVREPIYKEDYYIESGDTAMIRFDHFEVDNDGWKDFYAGKGARPLEDDSFGTVLSGIERASKNPEIKNIVIDISCNGGGDDTALLAIEWLLCGTGESMLQMAQRIYNLLDDIKAGDREVILIAHNGIVRIVESYFREMDNEEFSSCGIKNCEIKRYDF